MMRLRAGVGLLCVVLAGCRHVPEGVKIDLNNGQVEVGPCRCGPTDPEGAAKPVAAAPEAAPIAAPPSEVPAEDEPR